MRDKKIFSAINTPKKLCLFLINKTRFFFIKKKEDIFVSVSLTQMGQDSNLIHPTYSLLKSEFLSIKFFFVR